jgi:integrase
MWRGFGLVRLRGPALVVLCRLVAPEEIVMTIPTGTRRAEGVYQLEKGGSLWRIQVTRRDPQTRRRVCRRSVIEAKSLSLAKVKRAELALRLEEELAGALTPVPTTVAHPTVADFGERWLEERAARVRESTITEYLRVIERWVAPFMGHLKIRELNREVVTGFVSWMEDQRMSDGRAYSDSSLKSVFRVARGFLKDAAAEADVSDPTRRVRGPSSDRRAIRQLETLTSRELDELLWAVERIAPQWRALVVVMARTGMRTGELRALQWRDLDLDSGVIQVRRSMARKETYGTKTGSPREVPLVAGTVEVLREHREAVQAAGHAVTGQGLVFVSWRTGEAFWPSAVNRVLRNASSAAGLSVRVTAQVMRRTVNTLLLERTSGEVVRDILGHCSQEMTQRYHHASLASKREALGAFERAGW